MALTVLTTVISVPSNEIAMIDAGLKAFSTDKPFVPEAVEWPGVEYTWAGDEHGRLTVTQQGRLPSLGQRTEFFPPHCLVVPSGRREFVLCLRMKLDASHRSAARTFLMTRAAGMAATFPDLRSASRRSASASQSRSASASTS